MTNLGVYSELNKPTDFEFRVKSKVGNEKLLEDIASISVMDGTKPVSLNIIDQGGGEYSIGAKGGFTTGSTYEISLADGYVFKTEDGEEKEEKIRKATLTIEAEEQNKLRYNKDLIFISEDDTLGLVVDGGSTSWDEYSNPIVDANLNEEADTKVSTGCFSRTTDDSDILDGTMICVYAGEEQPGTEQPGTEDEKLGERASFLIVTGTDGTTVYFKEPDTTEELLKAYFIPDNIPFSVNSEDELPENYFEVTFTGEEGKYQVDNGVRTDIMNIQEIDNMGSIEVGDFITFYVGELKDIEKNEKDPIVRYGLITDINGNRITFKNITVEEIQSCLDTYMVDTLETKAILSTMSDEDVIALQSSIEKQVYDSGFADYATEELTKYVMNCDEFKNKIGLSNIELRDEDGNMLSPNDIALMAGYTPSPVVGEPNITATLVEDPEYFGEDGIGIEVGVELEITIEPGEKDPVKKALVVKVAATFKQEVKIDIKLGASADVGWHIIIPEIKSIKFDAAFDVYSYTKVDFDVSIYLVKDNKDSKTDKIKDLFNLAKKTRSKLNDILELQEKIKSYKEDGESKSEIEELQEQSNSLWNEFKNEVDEPVLDELELDDLVEAEVEFTDITDTIQDLLKADEEDEVDSGIQRMVERYSEMMNRESQWIEIVRKQMMNVEQCYYGIAANITVYFIIKSKVNVAIGSEIENLVGKRYCFYFDIIEGDSGSNISDLTEERFAFNLYAMGNLGLKTGLEVDITAGIGSTRIASIGGSAELGVYVDFWGYFIYSYSKYRPEESRQEYIDEQIMGAMLLDFGIYTEMTLIAQALGGKLKYEPVLYDGSWPLLSSGDEVNVYDFAYNIDPKSNKRVNIVGDYNDGDAEITMKLPDAIRTMKTLNLKTGKLENKVYDFDDFNFYMSNENFKYEPISGTITVTPPQDVRYMETDLRIVWKGNKAGFNKYDIDVTIPFVWSNLDSEEMKEPIAVNVIVDDGYGNKSIVYTDLVHKGEKFSIPSEDEVKKLINYDKYNVSLDNGEQVNLKYEDIIGYDEYVNPEEQVEQMDTNYTFTMKPKKYTIEILDNNGNNIGGDTAKFGESFTNINQYVGFEYDDDRAREYFKITGIVADKTDDVDNMVNKDYEDIKEDELEAYDNRDVFKPIDIDFAKELLRGHTKYKVRWSKNSANITYKFKGIDQDDIVIAVKKGNMPSHNDYRSEMGKEFDNAVLVAQDSKFIPVQSDATYVMEYSLAIDYVDDATITYDAQEGTGVADVTLPVGYSLSRPTDPVKDGYYFGGWYIDEDCTEQFEHDQMPDHDITVYAKWSKVEYELKYDIGNMAKLKEDVTSKEVTYRDPYGELPTEDDFESIPPDCYFNGWINQGGKKVTEDTIHQEKSNATIKADWRAKLKTGISISEDQASVNTGYVYYKESDAPRFLFTGYYTTNTGENIPMSDEEFKVEYQLCTDKGNTWIDSVNEGGTYNVKVSRKEDEKHKAFERVINEAYKVNKKKINIDKVPTVEMYNGIILVKPAPDPRFDNITYKYSIDGGENWSESPIFSYKIGTKVKAAVKVHEGDSNYTCSNAMIDTEVYSLKASSELGDEFEFEVEIDMRDKLTSGANDEYRVDIYDRYDNKCGEGEARKLESKGLYLDKFKYSPWSIKRLRFEQTHDSKGLNNEIEIYHITTIGEYNEGKRVEHQGKSFEFEGGNEGFGYSEFGDTFKRKIEKLGPTEYYINQTEENEIIELKNTESKTFEFSGNTKDQYTGKDGKAYNAYNYADAPIVYYEINNTRYLKYFTQKIKGFDVDCKGLNEAMINNKCETLKVKYCIKYPEQSTASGGEQSCEITLKSSYKPTTKDKK